MRTGVLHRFTLPSREYRSSQYDFRASALLRQKTKPQHCRVAIFGGRGAGGWQALMNTMEEIDSEITTLSAKLDELRNHRSLGKPTGEERKIRAKLDRSKNSKVLVIDRIGYEDADPPALHFSAAIYQAAFTKMLSEIGNGHREESFATHFARVSEALYTSYQAQANESLKKWVAEGRVQYLVGDARFRSPRKGGAHHIEVSTKQHPVSFTANNVILSTGSTPNLPKGIALTGTQDKTIETSEDFCRRSSHPKKICLIGGGVISLELASLLKAYGHQVTVLQRGDDILEMVDKSARDWVAADLTKESEESGKVKIMTRYGMKTWHQDREKPGVVTIQELDEKGNPLPTGKILDFEADEVVAVIGRSPNLGQLGLEHFGLTPEVNQERRGLFVEHNFQVQDANNDPIPKLFAIGDLPSTRTVTLRDESISYPFWRDLVRWLPLPIPPILFEKLDLWMMRRNVFVRERTQPLRMKLITTAEAQANQVTRFLFRGNDSYYDERDFAQKIFTTPKIAFFGPQNDPHRLSPERVFSVTRYYEVAGLASTEVRRETSEGFLKIYFDKRFGKIIAAVAVGPDAHNLVQDILDHKQTVTAMMPELYPLVTGPSRSNIIRSLLSGAKKAKRELDAASAAAANT